MNMYVPNQTEANDACNQQTDQRDITHDT